MSILGFGMYQVPDPAECERSVLAALEAGYGAGSIGQAIARRVSTGEHILLADLKRENADAAASVLSEA
jgi:hypothetical protein